MSQSFYYIELGDINVLYMIQKDGVDYEQRKNRNRAR